MIQKIKKALASLLTFSLVIQAVLMFGLVNPTKAKANELPSAQTAGDPDKILINEFQVSPTNSKFVEIFNANLIGTDPIDISGWWISDFANSPSKKYIVPDGTTLAPGTFYVFYNVSWLNADQDEFQLAESDSTAIEANQVTYGPNPFTQMMAAPAGSKSAGRVNDGSASWYSNLIPTPEELNSSLNSENSLPDRIASAHVLAGENNATDVINGHNVISVNVALTYENGASETTDSAKVYFSKNGETKSFTENKLTDLDLSNYSDGETYLYGLTGRETDENTIYSEYLPIIKYSDFDAGQKIVKDTVPPAQPTTAQVKAGDNNLANAINNSNKSAVSVDVALSETSQATDTVTAELSDGATAKTGVIAGSAGAGTVTVSGIDTTDPLNDGAITVRAQTTDAAGNSSDWFTGTNAAKDTVAPTGAITINNYATVTNSYLATLALTSSGTTEMMISNDPAFNGATWEIYSANRAWNLALGDKTDKIVYAKFKNAAGNISAVYSDGIYLNLATSNIVASNIIVGEQTISPSAGLELVVNGLTSTTLTTAIYAQNPGTNFPSGISSFGKYFELAFTNKDAVSWPVMIKIYYTNIDLANAGLTNEQQLAGVYYWDTAASVWKLYSQTGVNTNDITVNHVVYAGYVWANADHFTAMAIGSDITPPEKPADLAATARDGEILLNWTKTNDALGYYVRYREGTSIDNKPYTTIFISGVENTSTKVTGLKNNTLYEFGVQAIDASNNKSDWSVVVASPLAAVTLASAVITISTSASTAPEATAKEQPAQETEITTEGPELGQVKAQEAARDWTRFWITILILAIAAAAGYGGYYGYQWWTEEKTKNKPKPPQEPQKTGRW